MLSRIKLTQKSLSFLLLCDATGGRNLRQARALALVLQGRQLAFDQTRSCDLALQVLQSATAQNLAPTRTEKGRDEAVTRGLAWIKSHCLLD